MKIKNIAIIAHVDHGKTTLMDSILRATGTFSEREELVERVMDSDSQEQERGITIYAKNAAVNYKDYKINIIDTPGHADFGSEVERILKSVDATILVVDAHEGPMPQTKFVLQKSIEQNKKILVVINKIDKPTSRPDWVIDQLFDLFVSLGASDEQLEFPYIYAIARDSIAIENLDDPKEDIFPLMDFILKYAPDAPSDDKAPFRMQPATLDYDNFLGRIAIGRVFEGTINTKDEVWITSKSGKKKGRVEKLFTHQGLKRVEVKSVCAGDIVAIAGISDIYVGQTIAQFEDTPPIPATKIDPPTLAMHFMVNTSPFAGKEGKFVTGNQIKERLLRETQTNVGLKLELSETSDKIKVLGRGEMHLAVLIESMRREGFELQVSQAEVILHEKEGKMWEPVENVVVNTPDAYSGAIINLLSQRKGELLSINSENGNSTLEFEVPSRGLLGFRSTFVVITKGEGTLYSGYAKMAPYYGEIKKRQAGSLISGETGKATGYSLWKLQDRGPLFICANTDIYMGMILGESNKGQDLTVNAIKGKKLTNVRSAGADDSIDLVPPVQMTLEKALEYIKEDEYVEITPTNIRLRKKYLTEHERRRNYKK